MDAEQRTEAVEELTLRLRIAVGRLNRRIRSEKASDELGDGQVSVLSLLFREGPHTIGALAEYEHVTPPSMNRRINLLEEGGFVTREADGADRRRVVVTITDTGADFVRETQRRREEWLYRRTSALPPERRRLLAAAAETMLEIADS